MCFMLANTRKYSPKTNIIYMPENHHLEKGETSTNHQLLGSMLVFGGVQETLGVFNIPLRCSGAARQRDAGAANTTRGRQNL